MTWRIGEILIQKKLITWEQLNSALEEQQKTQEMTGEILIRRGYVSRPLLYRALAEQRGIQFVDIKRIKVNLDAVGRVPRSIAKKYRIMPLDIHDDLLVLGISNPIQMWPESELCDLAGVQKIRLALCLPDDIETAIETYYSKPPAAEK